MITGVSILGLRARSVTARFACWRAIRNGSSSSRSLSHRNGAALAEQIERFSPDMAVLVDDTAIDACPSAGVRTGRAALLEAASHPDADIVINAVVGAAGLDATLAALSAGKRLALANKESLVAGGPLVMDALRRVWRVVPVDSEHARSCSAWARTEAPDARWIITRRRPFRFGCGRLRDATPPRRCVIYVGLGANHDRLATLANKEIAVIEATSCRVGYTASTGGASAIDHHSMISSRWDVLRNGVQTWSEHPVPLPIPARDGHGPTFRRVAGT